MLDKMLIAHCAPTLRGIKTANLFTYTSCYDEDINRNILAWNSVLNSKGVSLHILHEVENRVLIYVCRSAMLAEDMKKLGVSDFLKLFGYNNLSAHGCIERLTQRVESEQGFPHEIGLFLGYPLEDVKGFIENSGKNCKCVGYWKVYGDHYEAMKQFKKFKKCKEIYNKMFEKRIQSVYQLTVAV